MAGFQKAVKKQSKARILLEGVSGSGKTWTGIQTAAVLAEGGPIAVIDSEQGSASLYADLFDFDVSEISAPFTPAKYVEAIKGAAKAGYPVVLIDSLTHAWAGTGGVLEMVDDAKVRYGGNTQRAWAVGTPAWQSVIDAMLQTSIHIVATLRSKSRLIEETDDRGKVKGYKKAGTEPVARDGIEFEFTITGDLDIEHNMVIGKSRCSLVPPGTVYRQPKGDLAEDILAWLNDGAVDTTALARELLETAGDREALTAALAKAKIGSADLADEKKLAKAREIASKIAAAAEDAAKGGAPASAPPAVEPGGSGQGTAPSGSRTNDAPTLGGDL